MRSESSAAWPSAVACPSQSDIRLMVRRMRTGSAGGSSASSAIILLASMV